MANIQSFLVLKYLRQSELGWFAACRLNGKESGNHQRSLNINSDIVRSMFGIPSTNEIPLTCFWHDGSRPIVDQRTITLQKKNWRLGGEMVRGERFGAADEEDIVVLYFLRQGDSWSVLWDIIMQVDNHLIPLYERCAHEIGTISNRLVQPAEDLLALMEQELPAFMAWSATFDQPFVELDQPEVHSEDTSVCIATTLDEVEPQLAAGSQALRPKARIIRAIGDELISSEVVAIAELVKNSYDADARNVLVRLVGPLEEGEGRVEVIDDGHGMTIETLRSAWMEPATQFKRKMTVSEQFGRRVLGEKGLGRFAAARVADYFYVQSRRAGVQSESRVLLDWKRFDDDTKYLDEIEVLWEVSRPKSIRSDGDVGEVFREITGAELDQGTILSLESLRKEWTDQDVRDLQRALSRMVSPIASQEREDFNIFLQAPKDSKIIGERIEPPQLLKSAEYEIQGMVDEDGVANLTLRIDGEVEPIEINKRLFFVESRGSIESYRRPACGPFKIVVRSWSRDPEGLERLSKQGLGNRTEIRKDLDSVVGTYLYRDGFRVLPYGEKGTDWLNLDGRRVQNPKTRLDNKQVSIVVSITRDGNDKLKDQSNREGLFQNVAEKDLKSLVTAVLSEMEVERSKRRDAQRTEGPRKQVGLFDGIDLGSVRELVHTKYPSDRELTTAVELSEKRITEGVTRVKEVLSRYQRLVGLGSLVDMVLHEGRQPVSSLHFSISKVRRELRRGLAGNVPSEILLKEADVQFDKMIGKLDVLSKVFKKLDPFSGRQRGRPKNVVLEDVIRDGVALVEHMITSAGITVTLPSTKTEVTVDEADIQQVIRNLVENAAYWLTMVSDMPRRIQIDVRRKSDLSVEIDVSDNGPGVKEDEREWIWTPYNSRKPDGVGLGLVIAGEIIKENYDGELSLVDDGALPGATFRITLTRRIGR